MLSGKRSKKGGKKSGKETTSRPVFKGGITPKKGSYSNLKPGKSTLDQGKAKDLILGELRLAAKKGGTTLEKNSMEKEKRDTALTLCGRPAKFFGHFNSL